MKKEPIIVNVYLWGTCIGKLNWDFEKHCSVFQFTDEYRKQDYDWQGLAMRLLKP